MPKKAAVEKRKCSMEATGFYSDASRDGMLYAVLVRSPAATGKVKLCTVHRAGKTPHSSLRPL